MRRIPPLLLCALAAIAQLFLSRSRKPAPKTNVIATVIAAGSVTALANPVLEFRRAGTTVDPRATAQAETLVTTGLNSLSRNPMYLGMAGLLTAHTVYRRSYSAAIPTLAFIAWIDRVQIPKEEVHLQERFGTAYENYRSEVRRWAGRQHPR